MTGVSPCVDRGDNVSSGALSTDLDGRQRRVDGDCDNESVVDMGACEFQRLCPWPSASVLGTGAGPWEHTRITARVNSLLLPALLPALLLVRRLLRNGDRKPR